MGQHHFFRPLKQWKAARFSQDKAYDWAAGDEAVDNNQDGVCGALVMYWIKDRLTRPRVAFHSQQRRESMLSIAARGDLKANHAVIVRQAARIQPRQSVGSVSAELNVLEQAMDLFSPAFVHLQCTASNSFIDALISVTDNLSNRPGSAAFLSILHSSQSGPNSAHALGFYYSRGGSFHVFEPNGGEYEVPTSDRYEFFTLWIDCCQQGLGWQFGRAANLPEYGGYAVYRR